MICIGAPTSTREGFETSEGSAVDSEALMEAVTQGQLSQVQKLLTEGVAVNDKKSDGQTVLMKAAAK